MNFSDGALKGMRVLDFTEYGAGPFCTMLLGDLGAEVIKVEPPHGDKLRQWGPFINGMSGPFMQLNRNKKSMTLNLKSETGREIAHRLVSRADIVVENFRPGIMDRLSLSYEIVSGINPAIIYCSLSGYGQTGPYRNRGGFDLIAQGEGGLMAVSGEAGRPPIKAGVPVVDFGAGAHAVIGILAAEIARRQTGQGQFVDISLLDVPVSWLGLLAGKYWATGEVHEPLGSRHPLSAPYQAFRTKDDYITIAAGNEQLWLGTCKALGLEHLANDQRFATNSDRAKNQVELAQIMEEVLITDSSSTWLKRLIEKGVPCGPINRVDQVLKDPQVLHREMVITVDDANLGSVNLIGSPIKLSKTPASVRNLAPSLGQHTDEILQELGYEGSELDILRAEVVGQ